MTAIDMINHPPHYTSCTSGIECIEIAEQLTFCLGNAYKYLHRAKLKGDELTDLKKARVYMHRAWLNRERISDSARNRILWVAHCRKGTIGSLLFDFCYFDADDSFDNMPVVRSLDRLIRTFNVTNA